MKWGLEECLAGTGRAEDRVGSEMDNSTLTRLVNLGHQAAHLPTHHRIHSPRSIGDVQWARKPRRGLSACVPEKQDSLTVKRNGMSDTGGEISALTCGEQK